MRFSPVAFSIMQLAAVSACPISENTGATLGRCEIVVWYVLSFASGNIEESSSRVDPSVHLHSKRKRKSDCPTSMRSQTES
jgi:hypothetical protein